MSGHGGDISWQALRRIVHDWLGTAAELDEVKPLHGGSINSTYALATKAGERAVLKISPYRVDRGYIHEAYQLNVLRTIGIPAPQVYTCQIGTLEDPVSYLLLEHVEGIDLNEAKANATPEQYDHVQAHLGELLLTIHSQTHSHYTRLTDGKRDEYEAWPRFFRHCFDAIWHEASKLPLLPVKVRKQIGKLHERLDRVLVHDDCPRLVHGDVWSTNVLVGPDAHGKWWVNGLIDPMCKYAHAESELAYLELFQTCNAALLRTYQATRRLPPEYHSIRKPVYQLYELLNHLQLFGAEYLKPLLATAEKVAQVV
jgi:fructosamine-3-kinase